MVGIAIYRKCGNTGNKQKPKNKLTLNKLYVNFFYYGVSPKNLFQMRKAISIFLASIILFNSIGFAINTHFCEGVAIDSSISIGIEHLDCGMPYDDNHSHSVTKEQVSKQSCCENTHEIIEVDNSKDTGFPSFDLNQIFLIAFVNTFVLPTTYADNSNVDHSTYPPPLTKRDVQVLFQTFLI